LIDMTRSHRLWGALALVATLAVASAPHALPRAQSGVPLTTQGTDHDVQVTFQAPPGPYFLGELLPITATIANHAGAPVTVDGPPEGTICTDTWVVASGGSPPSFPLPLLPMRRPPPPVFGEPLAPGASLIAHFVAPGNVALTLARHLLYDGRRRQLFVGAAPSVPLRVRPVAPPNRVLRLVPDGAALSVRVANGPVPPLLVTQQIVPARHAGFWLSPPWRAIKRSTIGAPPSLIAGQAETWTVLVGAAGYRIVIGSYSHVPLGPDGTTPLPTPTPLSTPAGTLTIAPTVSPTVVPTVSPTALS